MNKSYIDYLHLFVLVAFAVAQPIYELLGQNPEFFIAQGANSVAVITVMILVLSIGLPLVLVVFELVSRLISSSFQNGAHRLFVFGLTVLIVLPLMKKLVDSDLLIIVISLIFALSFVALYVRLQIVRMFVTVLLPVTFIFPILFLWATPIGRLVMPEVKDASQTEIKIENKVPVVVVVFDEFTTTALLDSQGRIDTVRYPNFAALASESWWYPNAVATHFTTVQAVPAILTGRQPRPEMDLVPTVKNYPRNIFTLLREKYRLTVFEPITEMCPEEVCQRESNSDTARRYTAFFADVTAIYLHMIAPPIFEKKLPHFGAQWAGFGKFLISGLNSGEETISDTARLKGWERRDLQIERFFSRLEKSTSSELHFIHVLLPHVPLEFLPSGHKYDSSPNYPFPDGMTKDNDNWIWTGEDSLILTSYHRYLQQVGYVDQFLGRLKNKLEIAGLYDEALIVLTADHGVSFQRGSPQRRIDNRNSRDILQVPMLVKLPRQREGRISERLVSGIDVLPTIIDVLGVKVPWELDGYSMISEEFSRTEIEIPDVGIYKVNDIKGFPHLKWQVEHFGTNTSLNHLVPKGPHQEIVGKMPDNLNVGDALSLKLRSEDFEYFKQVDMGSGFLPALFRANIEGSNNRSLSIAIALNGRIWATTKTSEWDGKHNYFSVLLPAVAFKDGRNLINTYIIEEKEGMLVLLPVAQQDDQHKVKLQRLQDGRESLLFSDGHEVLVDNRRDNMDGYLDLLALEKNMLVFDGWASDLIMSQPASDILFFKGKKLIWQVEPTNRRDDVVKAFNRQTLLRSGYRANIPLKVLESYSGDISVIAISNEKRAFRLHIKDDQKELLRATLVK